MLTRKHYRDIAEAILQTRIHERTMGASEEDMVIINLALDALTDRLAVKFCQDNPRFDYGKFMTACRGVGSVGTVVGA